VATSRVLIKTPSLPSALAAETQSREPDLTPTLDLAKLFTICQRTFIHSVLNFILVGVIVLINIFHIIPHICHGRRPCNFFLASVNFSRLGEKKCIYLTFSETFLVFLVPLVVFLGVKFGFRKSCLCKRNDKYEVCYKGPVLQAYFRLVNFDILGQKFRQ